eukprot:CAMPEP_0202958230 /NCGR_PEP_ID=MMETSP1396-20130829/2596_1 /ASSEMBLY_ACC=CAM_ASM_000872 /TAXON_ID= /ORGANISM="Pseudokeronopsis sp., Strain Brazil" /LENGTH=30 /DNA_ID= /DNA_START= /DNA_END= /DNA_ORIENTATION=
MPEERLKAMIAREYAIYFKRDHILDIYEDN